MSHDSETTIVGFQWSVNESKDVNPTIKTWTKQFQSVRVAKTKTLDGGFETSVIITVCLKKIIAWRAK